MSSRSQTSSYLTAECGCTTWGRHRGHMHYEFVWFFCFFLIKKRVTNVRPEVFHSVKLGDKAQVCLPSFAFVILEKPQSPPGKTKTVNILFWNKTNKANWSWLPQVSSRLNHWVFPIKEDQMHRTVISWLSWCLTCFVVDVWCRLLDSQPLECICHNSPSRAVWGLKLTPWGENGKVTLHVDFTGKNSKTFLLRSLGWPHIETVGRHRCLSLFDLTSDKYAWKLWQFWICRTTTQHGLNYQTRVPNQQFTIITISKWLDLQHLHCGWLQCWYSRSRARGSTEHSQRKTCRF